MRVSIYFSILFILSLTSLSFANVPAPRPPQKQIIMVQKNYPDYVFYYCTYSLKNDLKMDESTFKIIPITLANGKNFVVAPKDYWSFYQINGNLVAVTKGINEKIKGNLEEKLLNVVKNKQDEVGIYETKIPLETKMCKDSFCNDMEFDSILVVESLDERGLKLKGFDKEGNNLSDKANSEETKKSTTTSSNTSDNNSTLKTNNIGIYLSIILFSIAVTIFGIFFLRKSRRK